MPSPFIGGRIPQELYDSLQFHIEATGEKLPKVLINAISTYLGCGINNTSPPSNGLEKRVAAVEASIDRLSSLEFEVQQLKANIEKIQFSERNISQEVKKLTGEQLSILSDGSEQDDENLEMTNISPGSRILTHEQVARETGKKFNTVKGCHARKLEITKEGTQYKPVGEKGNPRWLAEESTPG